MSLEFNPVGMACNIACEYCYEEGMRTAQNINSPLDIEKALGVIDSYNQPFSLFGGEPLLLPIHKLEIIFQHGMKKWNQNGIQTNGILITSPHLELFKRYNVHVGFSIDGPWPINGMRCSEELTDKSISNLYRCLNLGISCSLIFTVTHLTIENENEFINWLSELDAAGLKSARIHLLESDNRVEKPDKESLINLLLRLEEEERKYKNLKFDLFNEITMLLQNPFDNSVTCVWNKCDPYTTAAVQGVGPSGERYNCGRTNKEGIQWSKSKQSGHERQIALYNTDCKDCRYFLACKGYCPGTAIDGDWRRKTEHCEVLYELFSVAEQKLHHARMRTYTQDNNLKKIELDWLGKLDCETNKNCHESINNSEDHIDWHIDGDRRTGNVPVIRR